MGIGDDFKAADAVFGSQECVVSAVQLSSPAVQVIDGEITADVFADGVDDSLEGILLGLGCIAFSDQCFIFIQFLFQDE